ncbi:MAG: tyrosinase family protein [Hyphomicrobiales bacterium]|nr:MAG: tyrosinase family protein [Hyphomicrobiales bacterium]
MVLLSRRTMLIGAAAAAAATVPLNQLAHSQSLRTRFNATTPEGKDMLGIYADVVAIMKKLDGSLSSSWTFQWFTHWVNGDSQKLAELNAHFGAASSPARDLAVIMWDSCQAHYSNDRDADFLPWHRACVYCFETIVRTVSGRDEFTLPYWDYTNDGVIPEEFRMENDPRFGVLYEQRRKSGPNGGNSIAAPSINLDALAETSYLPQGMREGFNGKLDGGLHGNVHVDVGGQKNMGVIRYAARDPLFWIHHCNIDRIWAAWNVVEGRQNPTDSAWLQSRHTFADASGPNGYSGVRVDFSNGDVTTTEQLSYVYDLLPGQAANLPPIRIFSGGARQIPIAQSDGAVQLGSGTTEVTLSRNSDEARDSVEMLRDENTNLYLILSGLRTNLPPDTVFLIYANRVGAAPEEGIYVGSVNFFDAEPNDSNEFKFIERRIDITAAIAAAAADVETVDAYTYAFVPKDELNPDALPTIGIVGLVKESGERLPNA